MFESFLVIVRFCLALFLSIVFCWVLGSIFHGFGLQFDTIFSFCLYLSAPLVLVIFDNLSMRKRVSCKFKGTKFSTFSTCFVAFVSSSIFIRSCDVFEAIWGSIRHHFSEKNPSENLFKRRKPPIWKNPTMTGSRGSQGGRLLLFFIKADASRARCPDNNNNKVKLNSIQFNSIQIELRSGWDLPEVWLRSSWKLPSDWWCDHANWAKARRIWIHVLCLCNGLSSVFKHRFWLGKESTCGTILHSRNANWAKARRINREIELVRNCVNDYCINWNDYDCLPE